jgi:hypothetical protein
MRSPHRSSKARSPKFTRCTVGPPPISWRIFWDILRFCSTIRIKNNRFGYRTFRDFATNDRIRRPDIRIFRDFGANEWIRRTDIRIFPDFATGTGTGYSMRAPDPYIWISIYTDFISGYFGGYLAQKHRIFSATTNP